MKNKRSCSTCVFEKGSTCKVLREKISYDCFAWADETEAQRRESAIKKYSGFSGKEIPLSKLSNEQKERRNKARKLNNELRGGKSVKQTLDEHFNGWYQQGLNDVEIGEKLHVDVRFVHDYRKQNELPAQNKKTVLQEQ